MAIIEYGDLQTYTQFASIDPGRLLPAWEAAEDWVGSRVRYSNPDNIPSGAPAALRQAVVLMTARFLARENSAEGLVGMGESAMYLPKVDRDVEALIGPYRPVVFG